MSAGKNLQKWILIVDDEPDIVNVTRSILELNLGDSARFIEAFDGVEATSKIAFQAFDLIITDLSMPRKEGNAFIQAVRESAMNASTPVIVSTGNLDELVDKEHKYVSYIEKPINQKKLIDAVETQLKLGRNTDSRVAADLLNAVIMSAHELIQKESGSAPEQHPPCARQRSEEIQGDFLQFFSIKVGNTVNDFVIGINESTFEKITHGVEQSKVSEIVGKLLIKHAIKNIKKSATQLNVVDSHALCKNSDDYKKMRKKCGIIVPIQKKDSPGQVVVQALWDRAAV